MTKHSRRHSRRHRKHSRSRRMRGGEGEPVVGQEVVVAPVEEPGYFDKALSFISEEAKPLTEEAKKQKEALNIELQAAVNNSKAQGSSIFDSIKSMNPFGSSDTPVVEQNPVEQTPVVVENPAAVETEGGRRRRRCKSMRMKGGRSNVGLSYYAAPVTDSVTAQPTYMMKSTGGRRQKSCKRKTCKRKTCRNRRSCRHRRRSRRH